MSDTRTSNSMKNIAFNLGYQFLTLILKFFNRTIFIQILGVSYLGISGLFSELLQMLCLADLGFGTAMTFSMYKPLAEDDHDKLCALVHFYKTIYRFIAIAIAGIGLALIPFLKYLINLDEDIPFIYGYYILFLANTVSSYLVVYKTSVISADQKQYVITKINSVFGIVRTVVMLAFLWVTHNYTVYLVVQVAFTYINNLYNSYKASKMYPFLSKKVELAKEEKVEIFNNIKSVFLYKFSGVLINATDNTLISALISTTMVGYYSNYGLITGQIVSVVNTTFYSLTSSLGNLIVKEGKEKRYNVFKMMQSLSNILSTFCVVALLILLNDLIRVWLGDSFLLSNLVLIAVVLNFYFSISLLPIWVFREATGLYRKTKYVMLITAAVNLLCSIILGKLIGLAGILFATSISRITTYFWYEPKLLFKKYFGPSCIVYFIGIVKSLFVTVVVYAVTYAISSFIVVNGWFSLIIKSIVVGLVSLVLIGAIYHKSEGIGLIYNKFKGTVHKRFNVNKAEGEA